MTKKKGIFLWTIITFLLCGVQTHISYALVCNTEINPEDIPSEIFHLDAQDIDGNWLADIFPWDWDSISVLYDKSSIHNLEQSIKNKKPTFDANAINGIWAIQFDGKKQFFNMENHADINTGWPYPEKSFAILFKTWNDINTLQTLYEQWWNSEWYNITIEQGHAYALVWNQKDWDSWHEYKTLDLWPVEINTVYSMLTIHSWIWNTPEENEFLIYMNGQLKDSVDHIGIQNQHSGKIGIWYTNGNSINPIDHSTMWNGHYFKWHIWELISWNYALSQDEIEQIQSYFSEKWAITLLREVLKVPEVSNSTTPEYRFYSNKNGTLKYNWWCIWNTNQVYQWINTIILSTDGNWKSLKEKEYDSCSIELEDNQWNKTSLSITPFTINSNLSYISEIYAIANITNNKAPAYTFYSEISGNIEYSWGCTSNTSQSNIGNNTIILDALNDWDYYNCSIRVQNFAQSTAFLKLSPFKIDTKAPIINEISPLDPENDYQYSFHINESGTLHYWGSCSIKNQEEKCTWNNQIFFSELESWTYDDCSIFITDTAWNISEQTIIDLTIEWWVSYITETGINFWQIKTSNQQRDIIIDYSLDNASFIEIDDLDINSNWYYLTVQSSNIANQNSTIDKNNIFINLESRKAKNNKNQDIDEIDIPPGLYNRWSGYKKIGTPLVVLERKKEKKGKIGKYKIKPKLKITIPPYQTLGNYTGTITYTLIEN